MKPQLPDIHPSAWIAPTAAVMGDVTLGAESSIRYGAVFRADMARVEIGAVADETEAFDRYLGDGRPGHVPKHALDPVDAVALIRGAGGVCVLAHPGMWGDQSSVPVELIERMAAAGMRGLEVDHPDHLPEQREYYRSLAAGLGLVATGGSDCHGTRYEPVRLGSALCRPEAFDELRAATVR